MKIAIITDSFGGPRIHNGREEVSMDQTYPVIMKDKLKSFGHEVEVDYVSYRRIIDLPEVISRYSAFDIYIFQAGIVDMYPRPLSMMHTLSQAFFWKLYRRIIRLNRRFFIKFLNNVTWSTVEEVNDAIEKVCKQLGNKRMIWVNVAPVNAYMEYHTPGANKAIDLTNTIIQKVLTAYSTAQLLDINTIFKKSQNLHELLHPIDAHLTQKGNQLYAEEISKLLIKSV
jgi:hypothetical protein